LSICAKASAGMLPSQRHAAPSRVTSCRKPIGGAAAIGQPLHGVAVADFAQVEAAARGYVRRAPHGVGVVGVEHGEAAGRAQGVLGIGADAAARRGQRDAVADAGEHVVQGAARGRVVEHLHARDEGHSQRRRALAQAVLHALFALLARWRVSRA
jgi:hypothetical protein